MSTKFFSNMKLILLFIILCFASDCSFHEAKIPNEITPSLSTVISQEETDENQFNNNAGNPISELIFDEYEGLIYKGADYEKYYKAEMDGTTYLISKSSYNEEECTEKIYYIDSLLDKVEKWYDTYLSDGLTVYLGDKITTHRTEDALYLNSRELSAPETLTTQLSELPILNFA